MKNRCGSLDFLKVVATILIVFHHYQQVTGTIFEYGINYYNGKFYFGFVVEFFFVMSGYFMFLYIEKIKNGLCFKEFYVNRLMRLLPLMGVAAISFEVLEKIYENVYGIQWIGSRFTFWGIIIDALGLQEGWVFTNLYVNNPTWYVAVLLLCYISFWFVTYISGKLGMSSRYFYVGMILLGCGISTYGINMPLFNSHSSRGFYAFFTGILLATYIYDREISLKEAVAALFVASFLLINIVCNYDFVNDGLMFILTFLLYPSLIILFRYHVFQKIFASKIWGRLGAISFDVYIWHSSLFILMYIIIKVCQLDINLGTRKSMYLFCLITWGIGLISYKWIEQPLNRLVKRKIKQHEEQSN